MYRLEDFLQAAEYSQDEFLRNLRTYGEITMNKRIDDIYTSNIIGLYKYCGLESEIPIRNKIVYDVHGAPSITNAKIDPERIHMMIGHAACRLFDMDESYYNRNNVYFFRYRDEKFVAKIIASVLRRY